MQHIAVDVSFAGLYEDASDLEAALPGIIEQVKQKVPRILAREPGCVCTALEADDVIKDQNGNTIGQIHIWVVP